MNSRLNHWIDIHEETAHNPQAWYYCAETLFESAEHIRRGLEAGPAAKRLAKHKLMDTHYGTYGLLLGYSVECTLKGLWVAAGNKLIEDGKFIVTVQGAVQGDASGVP